MRGRIVKGIGGFYYVETGAGVLECKARGLFRKEGLVPAVGDEVELDEAEAVIARILPRRNHFIRPPIANVDLLVVVAAMKDPKPNLLAVDRFLVMAERHHTKALLCFNKCDLSTEEERGALEEIYEGVYPLCFLSAKEQTGLAAWKEALRGKTAALAGASGVGKSTLLNALLGSREMETGSISRKSRRGKHTTRHVELFHWSEGMIFDTPGFTSFDVLEVEEEEELQQFFPEIAPYAGSCRFDNCRHLAEPGCAVRQALQEGKIHPARYASYTALMKEIQEKRRF